MLKEQIRTASDVQDNDIAIRQYNTPERSLHLPMTLSALILLRPKIKIWDYYDV